MDGLALDLNYNKYELEKMPESLQPPEPVKPEAAARPKSESGPKASVVEEEGTTEGPKKRRDIKKICKLPVSVSQGKDSRIR